MKKSLILMLVGLVLSFSAFADTDSIHCKQKLQTEAYSYNNFRVLKEQKGGLPEIRDCKEVHYARDSFNIDSTVYLTQDGRALIVQDNNFRAPNGQKGSVSYSAIPGQVREYKVMAGRLIISTQDNKILVVGRDGNVFEMLASDGQSYLFVTGIGIDSATGELVLKLGRMGSEARLSEEDITRRINTPGFYRAISLF